VVTLVLLVTGGPASAAPELRLEPASGQPGDPFTVTGSGFEPGVVELHWGSESGPHLGTAIGPDFTLDAAVPGDAVPNSHPVVAVVREGSSVSTSNASFQVLPGARTVEPEEPQEPEEAEAPEPTTTTTAAGRSTFDPGLGGSAVDGSGGGRAATGGLSRNSLGAGGGVEGDSAGAGSTTNGAQPAAGSAAPAPGVPAGDAATTTTAAVPASGVTDAAQSPSPSDAPSAARSPRASEDTGGEALAPSSTSQSSNAVRSPVLLVVGLGLVFGGGIVLAVRNRQRSGTPEELR
jgi:hypothetical protein